MCKTWPFYQSYVWFYSLKKIHEDYYRSNATQIVNQLSVQFQSPSFSLVQGICLVPTPCWTLFCPNKINPRWWPKQSSHLLWLSCGDVNSNIYWIRWSCQDGPKILDVCFVCLWSTRIQFGIGGPNCNWPNTLCLGGFRRRIFTDSHHTTDRSTDFQSLCLCKMDQLLYSW